MRDWSVLFCLAFSLTDPDLQKRGGGGGADIQTPTGGGVVCKKNFSSIRASAWSKNKGGGAGPPPLDPPLLDNVRRGVSLKNKRLLARDLPTTNLPSC